MVEPIKVAVKRNVEIARPDIEPERAAFFIDFDGTLAAIAERPDEVEVEPEILTALATIHRATNRLVIVSGRPVEALDRFLAPLQLPLAATHGLQFRNPDGRLQSGSYDAELLQRIVADLRVFASQESGLLVEEKPGSVALHYRARPELADPVLEWASALEAQFQGVRLLRGKMVVELRLGGRTKADAVSHFMKLPAFSNHQPVFIGDDVTDEDGFRRAQELGGIGIKIGAEPTIASAGFEHIEEFWHWLKTLAAGLRGGGQAKEGNES